MKFSIITPEHDKSNIAFLIELYETIKEQTYTKWEWIIYLNGNCTKEDLPDSIKGDPKVNIYTDTSGRNEVGYMKNRAFHLGEGDVLVEVDHDDLLTPDCLEELYKAYQDPTVGFVYSNNATYKMTGDFIPYNSSHGWTYTEFKWKDKTLFAMDSFPPTSHSLGYIWYAPDHVRSWKSSVYRKIGGHDEDLSICDDQELMQRTYLTTNFHHIDKVLYIYRLTGKNTYLERNSEIQQKTRDLFDTNIRALAEKDSESKNLFNIDIGGGLFPYGDYLTVDLRDNADYVADLNDGIPLPDNSCGVVNAHHILEHIKDPIFAMKEIHRVLAHGGWAFIEVPSTDGKGAFQDPTHVSFWNDNSFLYYTDKKYAQFIDNTSIRFQQAKKTNYYPCKEMQDLDILVTCSVLIAIKDDSSRFPGELKI